MLVIELKFSFKLFILNSEANFSFPIRWNPINISPFFLSHEKTIKTKN